MPIASTNVHVSADKQYIMASGKFFFVIFCAVNVLKFYLK